MQRLGMQGRGLVSANSPGGTNVTSYMFKRPVTVGTRDKDSNPTDPAQYCQEMEAAPALEPPVSPSRT